MTGGVYIKKLSLALVLVVFMLLMSACGSSDSVSGNVYKGTTKEGVEVTMSFDKGNVTATYGSQTLTGTYKLRDVNDRQNVVIEYSTTDSEAILKISSDNTEIMGESELRAKVFLYSIDFPNAILLLQE